MRYLLVCGLLTACAALAAAGAGSTSGAHPLSPNSISFWSASRGVLGTGPTTCSTCGSGTIQTTSDGGRTWRIRYRTPDRVTNVATAGRSDAWAVVQHCTSLSCRPRALLHSGDGGASWRLLKRGDLVSTSFGSSSRGFGVKGFLEGCCGGGAAVATSDGGRTWARIANPCSRLRTIDNLQSVTAPSARHAWALCVGQPGVGQQAKAVYKTRDGGRSWVRRAWAPMLQGRGYGGLGTGGYAQGIAIDHGGKGVLWESRGALAVTGDGGRHWRYPGVTRYDVDFGMSAAVTSDGTYHVLLKTGWRYRLIQGTDGGAHWRVVHRWG